MRILIVEDDKALNNGISLSFNDDEVYAAYTIREAQKFFNEYKNILDVIILDINLPDGSGLDFCVKVRKESRVPIIFLTANDMEIDIVSGLERGADDYITKPFSLAVLRARVNAVARRTKKVSSKSLNIYDNGDYYFDFDEMKYSCMGKAIELSKTEQKLLKLFVSNINTTLTRDTLIDKIWSCDGEYVDENALSVTITRLRRKIKNAPIKTIYAVGYMWEDKTC